MRRATLALSGATATMALVACALFPALSDLESGAPLDAMATDADFVDVAGDRATADAAPWCAANTQPGALCFDYDEPDASVVVTYQTNCDSNDTKNPCMATLAAAPDDRSPPNALVATIPALGPFPANAKARAVFAWPAAISRASIAFDLRTDGPIPLGVLGCFEWSTVIYALWLNGTKVTLQANDYAAKTTDYYPLPNAIDLHTWHRFELSVSPSSKTIVLTVDGVTAIKDAPKSVMPTGAQVAFTWGVDYVNGDLPKTTYHYDNVVLNGS
jgi:hypothetical protein